MKTVHIIFNAHLDPIWLWPWQAGLDECLATCRATCDILDAHPTAHFTRGEAWVYQQVERYDPELFARIKQHVQAGRWELIGGWWIQPDCNLPSGFGMERQIALGAKYFQSRFGQFPRIGYNVDSFGHAATLPGYLKAAGQERYVMMRPQEHEMPLPTRLFRWRGYEDGPEVTVFRIARSYCHRNPSLDDVQACLKDLPKYIDDTMCFLGVGDHGGGPTEKLIKWVEDNEGALVNVQLVFSTVKKFFEAIEPQIAKLPLITGELQHHAVGCYSTYRPVKTGVRKAEHLLRQAELMRRSTPTPLLSEADLEKGWQQVCFNQFHDTFGGTAIPSAYPQVQNQLGWACQVADEALQGGLRLKVTALPDCPLQRIVMHNSSDGWHDAYTEFEPWMEWRGWQPNYALLDENGRAVPYQLLDSEALCGNITRLLFRVAAPPGALRVFRIDTNAEAAVQATRVRVSVDRIATEAKVSCDGTHLEFPGAPWPLTPHLDLIEDLSDTWSHGLDSFPEGPAVSPRWNRPTLVDTGPLMASLIQNGTIGESRLDAEWRVYHEMPYIELRLRVHWLEKRKLLKLTLPLAGAARIRTDGTMGGQLARLNDGRERPLRDWTCCNLEEGWRVGVVCPDVFALDGSSHALRFTLLRSALMAHHAPHSGMAARYTVSDQGAHEFRFLFYLGKDVTPENLDAQALRLQRPLLAADCTRGMPKKA